MNAFPDLQVTVHETLGEGDYVAGRVTLRGTHLGTFLGIPASGKVIEWTESHFGRMANGKLVEHWGNQDQFGMLQQMGVIPAPQEQPASQPTH
jgi:predicted ester cyclase